MNPREQYTKETNKNWDTIIMTIPVPSPDYCEWLEAKLEKAELCTWILSAKDT